MEKSLCSKCGRRFGLADPYGRILCRSCYYEIHPGKPKCWQCTNFARDDHGGYCRAEDGRGADGDAAACEKFSGR